MLPTTCTAFRAVSYGTDATTAVKKATDAPVPPPSSLKKNELLVRVLYSGFCSGDIKLQEGHMRAMVDIPFPCVVGRDVCGVVVARGGNSTAKTPEENAALFEKGQRAFDAAVRRAAAEEKAHNIAREGRVCPPSVSADDEEESMTSDTASNTPATMNVGDIVCGMCDEFLEGRGTFVEYCIIFDTMACPVPPSVPLFRAGGVCVAAVAAFAAVIGSGALPRATFDAAVSSAEKNQLTVPSAQTNVAGTAISGQEGPRVLVLGGSCQTGQSTIQLCRAAGASFIASTSSNGELVRGLGAHLVLNHRAGEDWKTAFAPAGQSQGQTQASDDKKVSESKAFESTNVSAAAKHRSDFDVIVNCIEGAVGAWTAAQPLLRKPNGHFVTLNLDDPSTPIGSKFGFITQFSKQMWRTAAGKLTFPRYSFVASIGHVSGLREVLALMTSPTATSLTSATSTEAPTESSESSSTNFKYNLGMHKDSNGSEKVFHRSQSEFEELWAVQVSGRAHGRLVMAWW